MASKLFMGLQMLSSKAGVESMVKMMGMRGKISKPKAKAATKAKRNVGSGASVSPVAALILIEMSVSDAQVTTKLAEIELSGACPELCKELAHVLTAGRGPVL